MRRTRAGVRGAGWRIDACRQRAASAAIGRAPTVAPALSRPHRLLLEQLREQLRPRGRLGDAVRLVVVVEERVGLLGCAGELAQRLDPLAQLVLGVEVVEALRPRRRRACSTSRRCGRGSGRTRAAPSRRRPSAGRCRASSRGASTVTYAMPRSSSQRSTSSTTPSSNHDAWRNSTSIASPPSWSGAHSR